jgi:hypothetical protein
MKRAALVCLAAAAFLSAASPARAQFVQLSRCQAAWPCAAPFGIRYNPDPLIAGQYGNVPVSAFSVRIDPTRLFQLPAFDLSRELERQDFARDAARIFVLRHPVSKPRLAEPEASEGSAAPAKKQN